MGIQRNNPQMREKRASPEKEVNETGKSNLSDIEFKTMVIKMLRNLVQITAARKGK